MGIRLDWEVEAEHAYQRAGEDPEERSVRRHQRARILFFTVGMLLAICAFSAVIWYRLYTVDQQLKHDLINTVQAEVATLRVGNLAQFLAIQRTSPEGTWYQEQSARFQRYQVLKQKSDIRLTGNVVDTAIDGPRGRAVVEEIVDGVSYHTVWFYWRYADGWRHVPSDYTFWGNPETISGKVSTIQYDDLDAPLAQALGERIDKWWSEGCGYVGCTITPQLTVQIIAYQGDVPMWDPQHPYTLTIPSPLASGDRSRADITLSQTLEDSIAQAVALKAFSVATNNLQPVPTADAAWLQQGTVSWLAAQFTGRSDPAKLGFMQSLEDHYGTQGLVDLLHGLSPSSDIGVIGLALRQPVQALALDWRTFFQWRLDVEKALLQRNDTAGFQALWDAADPTALAHMRQRMAQPQSATPQVQAVTIAPGTDGVARATVQATANNQPVTIVFRLVDGAWRRST